ncbi:hypothetical protein BH09BAC1_BH09BAC1_08540 [soil metagenome]
MVFTFIVVIIIIVCILLSLAVLIQNPKGSGLGAGFANIGNQVMGARRATETIEKATWTLALTLLALTLLSAVFLPTGTAIVGTEEGSAAAKTLENRPLTPNIGDAPALGAPSEPAPSAQPVDGPATPADGE